MSRFRPISVLLFALLTAGVLLTSGCGNKGPLYLPDNRSEQQK